MKVLFDQNTPRKLRRHLRSHLVMTAAQMGWRDLENGSLILVAELAGFDVLVTGDQSIYYQQNNLTRQIALVVLTDTYWPDVDRNGPAVLEAVDQARPGSFIEVKIVKTKAPRG